MFDLKLNIRPSSEKYIRPALISGLAFMMSGLASTYCKSIAFQPSNQSSGLPVLEFGPWYVSKTQVDEIDGEVVVREICEHYPAGSDIDTNWKIARAFSIIAPLIGGALAIGLTFVPCDAPFFRKMSRWNALAKFIMAIMPAMQGLTFFILNSNACGNNPVVNAVGVIEEHSKQESTLYNARCEWGTGLGASFIASVLWFLAGLYMVMIGPPPAVRELTRFERRALKYKMMEKDDRWDRFDI